MLRKLLSIGVLVVIAIAFGAGTASAKPSSNGSAKPAGVAGFSDGRDSALDGFSDGRRSQ